MLEKAVVLISPAGIDRPRALAPVANRPLLLHVLDSLEAAGVRDVLLATEAAFDHAVEEVIAGAELRSLALRHFTAEQLTVAAAIRAAEHQLGSGPLLVHLADSLAHDLTKLLPSSRLADGDSLLLVDKGPQQQPTVVNLTDCRSRVPRSKAVAAGWLPAGVAAFGAGAAAAAAAMPAGGGLDSELVALAEQLSGPGGRLETRPVDEWLRFGQQRGALLEANRFALEATQRQVPDEALSEGSVAQGRVSIHETARLGSTVVRGPAVIGAGARLTDAYVGPYTAIAENVVIDGSEIEHSVVLPGARISDLAGRLEGSVIGSNARVFRDFRLPSALRVQIGEGSLVSVL